MKITMRNASIYAATLGCLLLPATGISATLEDVDQRLKKLEGDVATTQAETDDLTNRYKNNMTVSGYADTEYISTNNTDPDANKSGFRLHHFSVFMKKQINENLRFFSETEWEDGPFHDGSVVANAILLEAINFDYQWSPDTNMRVGRFFTPAGIWSVDHYPPFVLTQDLPQHIREIFPQLVDGASISGNHGVGNAFVNYNLYIGNGETLDLDGKGDSNSTTAAGLRIAVALPIAQHFEIGSSLYHDKLAAVTDSVEPKKNVAGVHAKLREGAFGFQAEYADGKYTPTISPATNLPYHKKGYYAQFSYDISKWTLGYRYDFFNPQSTVALNGTKINSAIVNYHASKNVVLKWEHHRAKLDDPAKTGYYRDIASIVVNLD